jgi:hypothetical protein
VTWPVDFRYRIPFQDPDRESPIVVARLQRDGSSRRFEFRIDTGAQFSVMDGDSLRPLGFNPPDPLVVSEAVRTRRLADIGCQSFGTVAGETLVGFGFEVSLSIAEGPSDVEIMVYGSVTQTLRRNLLGRDFMQTIRIVGVDAYNARLYFSYA